VSKLHRSKKEKHHCQSVKILKNNKIYKKNLNHYNLQKKKHKTTAKVSQKMHLNRQEKFHYAHRIIVIYIYLNKNSMDRQKMKYKPLAVCL